jgi:hypothetical protein
MSTPPAEPFFAPGLTALTREQHKQLGGAIERGDLAALQWAAENQKLIDKSVGQLFGFSRAKLAAEFAQQPNTIVADELESLRGGLLMSVAADANPNLGVFVDLLLSEAVRRLRE